MLYLINYEASSTGLGWGKHKVYIMADGLYEVNLKWERWMQNTKKEYEFKLKSIEIIEDEVVV